jgi:hypothetical protein
LCLAWEPNNRYIYKVQGRALTALHQLSNQFTGILIKADLAIEPQTRQELTGKVRKLNCYHEYYQTFEENRINSIKSSPN